MTEETKPTRRYTVVTSDGHWGKGMTPAEAAKNAHVTSKPVRGIIYDALPGVVEGEIDVNGMGGTSWTWTDKAADVADTEVGERALKAAMKVAQGKLKLTRGVLTVTVEL